MQFPVEGALWAGRHCLVWVIGGMQVQVAGTPGGCVVVVMVGRGLKIAF